MYTEATGQAARLLPALARSTGLALSQWGRRCSDQVLCDADNLCQVGQPGHLLPACPARSLCLQLLYVQYSGAPAVQHAPACGRPARETRVVASPSGTA